MTCIRCKFGVVGETGVSWSENCIFPYDEVDTHKLMFFLHSATSIVIFLTYSIDFLSENDIFLLTQPFSVGMSTGPTNPAIGVSWSRPRGKLDPRGLFKKK